MDLLQQRHQDETATILAAAVASSTDALSVLSFVEGAVRPIYENAAARCLELEIRQLEGEAHHSVVRVLDDATTEVIRTGERTEVEINVGDRVHRVESAMVAAEEGESRILVFRRCKDITEWKRADWTSELLGLARVANTAEAVDRALEIGCNLLDLPIGVFVDLSGDDVRVRASRGTSVDVSHLELSETMSDLVRDGRVALVRDLEAYGFTGPVVEAFEMRALAAVPVFDDRSVRAALCFGDTGARQSRFPANSRPLLEALGVTLANLLRRDSAVAEIEPIEVLRRSNRELGEYAYAAAHDLRSPLRAIRGFTELLAETIAADEVDRDRAERLADRIEAGVDRMERLLSEMLEHALEHESAPTSTCLNSVVEDVIVGLEPLMNEIGATVDVGTLPVIELDASQAARVMQNLLENAIKYRHADRPLRVTIAASIDHSTVVLRVADNGQGISDQARARIFELFRRATDDGDGFGVGLALVKRVVEDAGGTVDLVSSPGVGTTFELRFPASIVTAEAGTGQ